MRPEDLPSLRQAAERGDPNAQFELGVRYAEGKGVAPDDKEAARWILKAAEQGHLEAQFNLGLMYADGNGVPLDESKGGRMAPQSRRPGRCARAGEPRDDVRERDGRAGGSGRRPLAGTAKPLTGATPRRSSAWG